MALIPSVVSEQKMSPDNGRPRDDSSSAVQ